MLQARNSLGLDHTNVVIDQKRPGGGIADYSFVIVHIDDDDIRAGTTDWKVGDYLLDIESRRRKAL
jgi:hypothetical protein